MQKSSREVYERVLRMVECQTGGPQPPMVRRGPLLGVIQRSNFSLEQGERALRAAVANGDLLFYADAYARVDEDALLAVVEAEADRAEPRHELIAQCNHLLAACREATA